MGHFLSEGDLVISVQLLNLETLERSEGHMFMGFELK